MPQVRQVRHELFDALRGVAAAAVVLLHMNNYLLGGSLMASGYLAVDLFFMISGFVNAQSLDRIVAAGGSAREFLAGRFRRIFPFFALGLCLGFSIELAKAAGSADPVGAALAAIDRLAIGIVGVPDLGAEMVMPLNPVFWSLILEAAAYLAHATLLGRVSTRLLAIGVAASAVALAWVALAHGSLDVGARTDAFPLAFARLGFGYLGGMLLYRACVDGLLPRLKLGGALVVLTALAVFVTRTADAMRPVYDLIAVVVIFPALVTNATQSSLTGAWREPLLWAGRLSYPLYALHVPVMFLIAFVERIATGAVETVGTGTSLAVVFAATVVVTSLLARGFERRLAAPAAAPLRRPSGKA